MKILMAVIATLALAPGARAHEASDKKSAATKTKAVFMTADEMKWSAAPPALPAGAQVTILNGDPFKKGTYTVRIKMPDGYRIPPHWHTLDEQLTTISGTLALHMGDSMDAPANELGPGAYHFLPGKMHHAAESKGETILQIHGTGPFDIHYLNPADDPRKTAATTKK